MFIETAVEIGVAYSFGKKITVHRRYDVYKCDHCKAEARCLRLPGTNKPTEPFYCAHCNKLITL